MSKSGLIVIQGFVVGMGLATAGLGLDAVGIPRFIFIAICTHAVLELNRLISNKEAK